MFRMVIVSGHNLNFIWLELLFVIIRNFKKIVSFLHRCLKKNSVTEVYES